jgi:RNA polymerase sigma-70 factor (ECF subfamily)
VQRRPRIVRWFTTPVVGAPVVADEAELLRRVAAGDRNDALEELYRRYAGRLYGLGMHLLGDASLAEELVQETFVRLWRTAGRYDPDRGSVATYVFAIGRRIAIDLWRRPSSRPFAPDPPERPVDDPTEAVLSAVTVQDAIASLSPSHREILNLGYGEDRKQKEIAELLGVPLGTVKTRTFYALRALKLALQERGFDV